MAATNVPATSDRAVAATAGLYSAENEHDACGVALVADLAGRQDHEIVRRGLTALLRLEHRGARGAEYNTGDGVGILIQVPDAFLRAVVDFALPPAGEYAVGTAFLPTDDEKAAAAVARIEKLAAEENLRVLGWRDVPTDVDKADLGPSARAAMPPFRQLFVTAAEDGDATARPSAGIALERRTFCLRKRAEHETGIYFPSLSPRTLVYKGMLAEPQLEAFYPDLADERVTSALALVHSRFSTNTFPSWSLAHPYRYVAHNGEINTLRGNRNWMAAREALLASDLIPGDLGRLSPIVTPDASDSATFDEVLELLHLGGRSLPHAVLMMIPEAWENHGEMDPARRAFYEFHSTLMEPWDGPALVSFTDGTVIGAVLDRNGLRPARYWVTEDGLVALASEVGVLDVPPGSVVQEGPARAGPHVPDRHRRRPHRRRRRDQGRAGRRAPVRGLAARRPDPPRRPAGARARGRLGRGAEPAPAVVRLHRGGAQRHPQADGRLRGGADRLDGQRRRARLPLGAVAVALRLLQPAVRPGHEPAAGRDPRGAGHLAALPARFGAEPARTRARRAVAR